VWLVLLLLLLMHKHLLSCPMHSVLLVLSCDWQMLLLLLMRTHVFFLAPVSGGKKRCADAQQQLLPDTRQNEKDAVRRVPDKPSQAAAGLSRLSSLLNKHVAAGTTRSSQIVISSFSSIL
jgi:hypothetical protein